MRLTTRNEPLTALRLATATRNFSRPVRVEVWADGAGEPTWRPLGSATVSRLDFRDLQREQLEVTFPETRATAYRLVIENRDSPPLDVTGVEARGTAYEAVFLARPTATYRLAYRSPSIRAPNYDTTAVAAALAADYRPMVGALGEAAHLSPEEPEPGAPLAARLLNSPVFLTAAVGVLVVVLGVGLYRAARRLDNLPP